MQDIFEVMKWCCETELGNIINVWMQQASATYIMLCQMRAMQVCVNYTQIYANKLMKDHPSAVEFKNAKSLGNLQKMLTAMAVPAGPQTAQHGRRNRAAVDELIDPSAGRIAVNTARLEQTSSSHEGLVNPSEECASRASRSNKSIEGIYTLKF